MATGTFYSLISNKVITGLEKIATYGLTSTLFDVRGIMRLLSGSQGWWFDLSQNSTLDTVDLDITVADKVGIETGVYGLTANGRIVLTNDDGSSSTRYPFPNASATTYYIYVRAEQIPVLVERTTDSQYAFTREIEALGFLAAPTSVTDNGNGTITFNVNSVCQSLSCAGRKARVWKRTPMTDVTSVAFEELTVAYSGGNNTITTAAKFGQASVSTTAADYYVMLIGPVIRTSTYSHNDSIFVGTVVGGGSGSVPASKSLTGQPVWQMWIPALNYILRFDSHGYPKIRVQTDSSDSDESQIEVYDSVAGATTWKVDEDGDMTMGRSGGGTQRTLTITTNSNKSITVMNDGGNVKIDRYDDTANTTEIDGVVVAAPSGNGNDALISTVALEGSGGASSNGGSIVGAINSLAAADEESGGVRDFVYNKLGGSASPVPTITGVGGANVTVSAFAYRAKGGMAWNAAQTLTPANGTTYLVTLIGDSYGPQQNVQLVSATALALSSATFKGSYVLAKVVKSGGVISSITRLARPYRLLNANRDITVGPFDAGGDFETLKEAVDYVNEMDALPGTSSPRRITIRVIGSTTEAAAIVLTRSCVTIVGPAPTLQDDAITTTWTHTGNCLEIASSADVEIRNLTFVYSNVSDGGAGIALTHASLAYNITIAGCGVKDDGTGGEAVYGLNLGTCDDVSYVRVLDCHFAVKTYGILRASGDSIVRCWFSRNVINQSGGTAAGIGIGIASDVSGARIFLSENDINGFQNAIVLSKTQAFARDNRANGFSKDGIQVIYDESAYSVLEGNVLHGSGGSESTSYGIYVAAPRVRVIGNDAKGSPSATTKRGIQVDASPTDYCILVGNQTNGQTLQNGNPSNTTSANNRDDA